MLDSKEALQHIKVIGLVLGPLISGLVAAWSIHLMTRSREREARQSIRRDAQIDRRNEFQRETLLEL